MPKQIEAREHDVRYGSLGNYVAGGTTYTAPPAGSRLTRAMFDDLLAQCDGQFVLDGDGSDSVRLRERVSSLIASVAPPNGASTWDVVALRHTPSGTGWSSTTGAGTFAYPTFEADGQHHIAALLDDGLWILPWINIA